MKKLNQKLILALLVIMGLNSLQAQCLVLKAQVENKYEESITAQYILKSDNKKISSGSGTRIKLRLEFNRSYSLTFQKPGYKSKTIHFNTYTEAERQCLFKFFVELQESIATDPLAFVAENTVGRVFFDSKKMDFTYTYIRNTLQ